MSVWEWESENERVREWESESGRVKMIERVREWESEIERLREIKWDMRVLVRVCNRVKERETVRVNIKTQPNLCKC